MQMTMQPFDTVGPCAPWKLINLRVYVCAPFRGERPVFTQILKGIHGFKRIWATSPPPF